MNVKLISGTCGAANCAFGAIRAQVLGFEASVERARGRSGSLGPLTPLTVRLSELRPFGLGWGPSQKGLIP